MIDKREAIALVIVEDRNAMEAYLDDQPEYKTIPTPLNRASQILKILVADDQTVELLGEEELANNRFDGLKFDIDDIKYVLEIQADFMQIPKDGKVWKKVNV